MIGHLRPAWTGAVAAVALTGAVTAALVAARWHAPVPVGDLVVSSLAFGASAVGAIAGHAVTSSPPPPLAGMWARPGWQLRLVPLTGFLLVAFVVLAPTAARAGVELVLIRQLLLCTGLGVTTAVLVGRFGAVLPVLWSASIVTAGRDGGGIAPLWQPLYETGAAWPTVVLTLVLTGAAIIVAARPTAGRHLMATIGHREVMRAWAGSCDASSGERTRRRRNGRSPRSSRRVSRRPGSDGGRT